MAINPLKALIFLAGGLVAALGVAWFAGAFDPLVRETPSVAVGSSEAPAAKGDRPTAAPSGEKPQAEAPAAASAEVVPPSFDILRVEPNGSIVIAGKAAPNARVEILSGSQLIGQANAGGEGDFAAVLDNPLKPGDYQIVLRSTAPGNVVAASPETAVVSIPSQKDGQVLALVEQPGEPSRLITVPKPDPAARKTEAPQPPAQPQPDSQAAKEAPPAAPAEEETASGASPTEEAAGEATPAEQEVASEASPTEEAASGASPAQEEAASGASPAEESVGQAAPAEEEASTEEEAASGASPAEEGAGQAAPAEEEATGAEDKAAASDQAAAGTPPASSESQAASPQPAPDVPSESSPETAPPAGTSDAGTDMAAAPATPTVPEAGQQDASAAQPKVAVEAVEIEGRKVFVAGVADPGSLIRVYANEILLGEAEASEGGRFLIETERDLPIGDYIIRADVLAADGSVAARAAVPFTREEGESIAAVAPPAAPKASASGEAKSGAEGTATSPETEPAPRQAEGGVQPPSEGSIAAAPVEPPAPTGPDASGQAAPAEDSTAAEPKPKTEAADGELVLPQLGTNLAAAPPTVTAPKLQAVDSAVIIRRGDNLWRISRRVYGRGVRYTTIYLANQDQISDPDRIWPGQVFAVPDRTPEGEAADMEAVGDRATTMPPKTQ